jgi:predicted DNA-binding transcriptional regulator YafY
VDCSVRTLRAGIQAMQDCGFDIGIRETEGRPTRYCWRSREWERTELQILIDAVSSAQFIPQKRSETLVKRLSAMAGPSWTEKLKPRILVSEHIKAKNTDMIYTVETVCRAMEENRKISFRYLRYTGKKEQVPKRSGAEAAEYVVSPYATVWNNDRYYLVGWSDKREKVTVFRIDRMEVPKQLPTKRIPPPEDFDVRDYTDKVFRMYDGPEENVTLQCSMEILDQVIDQFGEQIELKNKTKKQFTITVPVSLSTTFYAWVFQYVGKMNIIEPEYVKEEYQGYLREAINALF